MTREEAKTILEEVKMLDDSINLTLDKMLSSLPSVVHEREKGEWIPIKTRPLTEEERIYYEEYGAYYFDSIFDCRLPEDGQEVLITTKYGTVEKVTFYNEGDDGSYFEYYEGGGEVLAWQPLPEPYKAESEDK